MRILCDRRVFISVMVLGVGSGIGLRAISQPEDTKSLQAKAGSIRVTALLRERRDLSRQRELIALAQYQQGQGSAEDLQRASIATLQTDLALAHSALAHSHAERLTLRQRWVNKTQDFETRMQERYNLGTVTKAHMLQASAARLEAETALAREKRGRPPAKWGHVP